jgi:hypothetical protein
MHGQRLTEDALTDSAVAYALLFPGSGREKDLFPIMANPE